MNLLDRGFVVRGCGVGSVAEGPEVFLPPSVPYVRLEPPRALVPRHPSVPSFVSVVPGVRRCVGGGVCPFVWV